MPRNAGFESTVVVPGPLVPVLRQFGVPPLAEHKSGSQGLGLVAKEGIGGLPPAEQLPSSRKPGPAIAVAPGRTGAIYRALRTAAPYSSILLQPGIYTVRGGVGGGGLAGSYNTIPTRCLPVAEHAFTCVQGALSGGRIQGCTARLAPARQGNSVRTAVPQLCLGPSDRVNFKFHVRRSQAR
jgi:hypothetical protein